MTLKGLRFGFALAIAMTIVGFVGSQEAKAQHTSVYVGAGYPAAYYPGPYYTPYSPPYVVRYVRYAPPVVVYRPAPVVPCYVPPPPPPPPPPPRSGFGFYLDINHSHGGHGHNGGHDRPDCRPQRHYSSRRHR